MMGGGGLLGGEDGEDEASGVTFRDTLFLMVGCFIAVVILLISHVNPPGEKQKTNADPPGNILTELSWPPDQCADVDLWVQAPGDAIVGYTNKGGQVFNLLRDDLGCRTADDAINLETAYTRGYPAGEYTINAHLYRVSPATLPIRVLLKVGIKLTSDASLKELVETRVELTREGQEITLIRFKLDDKGALVPGSLHHLQRDLRTRGNSNPAGD